VLLEAVDPVDKAYANEAGFNPFCTNFCTGDGAYPGFAPAFSLGTQVTILRPSVESRGCSSRCFDSLVYIFEQVFDVFQPH
jgi:hypothetical protein